MDRTRIIFNNVMDKQTLKKAEKSKQDYEKKFCMDSPEPCFLTLTNNLHIGELLGVQNIEASSSSNQEMAFNLEGGLIIGNIDKDPSHYRISMAIASAAHAMGYIPYWIDLSAFPDTAAAKIIKAQKAHYPSNSELPNGLKFLSLIHKDTSSQSPLTHLACNAIDQKNAELMAPFFNTLPPELPIIASHAWFAQAACHAGMKHVVNMIPDNFPMALHLSEGSLHTVQTHSAYLGYRTLNGMDKNKVLHPMPSQDIIYTGHYVDHELVRNIEADCKERIKRLENHFPMRFLLAIDDESDHFKNYIELIQHMLPLIQEQKAALYINLGRREKLWDDLTQALPELTDVATAHFNAWNETLSFTRQVLTMPVTGIHAFCHENIFEAVYTTNLLQRSTDVLLTSPNELAFYPLPKLFLKHDKIQGQWNALHSCEIGDGTLECTDLPHALQLIDLFLSDSSLLKALCQNIIRNKSIGLYDGAYKVVELALALKNKK